MTRRRSYDRTSSPEASTSSRAYVDPHVTAAHASAEASPVRERDEQQQQPRERVPTPLRGLEAMHRKQCYVCYEESTGVQDDLRRPWVHACSCTLVAHHDCLLEWVTTYQQSHTTPPSCPVCGTPYVIREKAIPLLKLYKRLVRRWERLSMVIALTSVSGSAIAMSGLYGVWAIKTWAGKDVAKALFDRKWPISYYRLSSSILSSTSCTHPSLQSICHSYR